MAKKKVTEVEEEVKTSVEETENKEIQEEIPKEENPETPEDKTEKVEETVEYYLDNGEKCSRSAYIRQEFAKDKSRQDIAKELDVPYYAVYSATANMFNAAHPADASGNATGRTSVIVPRINKDFKFIDAAGNTQKTITQEDGTEIVADLTAEDAAQVPRADLMRELADAGVERTKIKDYFGVAYATVYAATKEATAGTGAPREKKMITHPETGVVMKRNDYIRELYDGGMERRAIAKKLTDMTGELVDYAVVWAATKTKKDAETAAETSTESAAEPVEQSAELTQE